MTTTTSPVAGRADHRSLSDLDAYTARALALARGIVVDHQLAEDVVQEAFLAHWRNPAAFDSSRGAFSSWLLALVHHKAVDAVRRETAQRRRLDAVADGLDDGTGQDVLQVVDDRLADAGVRRALEGLPLVQREALVLAYWGGYTQREIALRTGVPLGTVKTRMLMGMRRLHASLGARPGGLVVVPTTSSPVCTV